MIDPPFGNDQPDDADDDSDDADDEHDGEKDRLAHGGDEMRSGPPVTAFLLEESEITSHVRMPPVPLGMPTTGKKYSNSAGNPQLSAAHSPM